MSKDTIKIRGFSRIALGTKDEKGNVKILHDSGFIQNAVVNQGFQDFLVGPLGAIAGSSQVGYGQLGTGGVPNVTDVTLPGETGARKATSNSLVGNATMQATCEWASTDHPGGTPAISNLGLYATNVGANLAFGNTFASSTWATNQGVSMTYQIRFS